MTLYVILLPLWSGQEHANVDIRDRKLQFLQRLHVLKVGVERLALDESPRH